MNNAVYVQILQLVKNKVSNILHKRPFYISFHKTFQFLYNWH